MNTANLMATKTYKFDQYVKKPLFTQPSVYKMAEEESEMIGDDEINMDEQVC